ncbi:sensor histidine kinase [Streptomyces sp. NBC_01439]|uniref:sensor histidine kinase n=1 Tax=Streptomyces sp. NBC_01439 TaxID=2903867 RepID=UPI002E2890D4|nr:DUF4118 domain-containing protein [Streptomyces sp. NBC_01439]
MVRGRLRIYLGAAPGVGKTYAMLQEGQRMAAVGAEVVVGFVEPHGRRPTAALAEGLETVPRRTMEYRGAAFTEMDLDRVLARRPQVALVDELAHTNVPGSRHAKRWQDVEELLDAGIDVVTTLNVQHLESLGDVVRQITGVPQRETLPDEVARRADQIELVDLPPELLRRRMLHGEIYPSDRIEAALTHYFRVGNLTALRELALLWLADRVEEGLQRYRAEHGITTPWETRERIMVALTGGPEGDTLIRRAARISARVPGSELLALHVVPSDGLTHGDPAGLAAQRALVESLGGSYHQSTGDDIPEALLQFAEAENVTQIVLGASRRGRLSTFLQGSVGHRTIRRSGPIDVLVITHEHAAGESSALRLPHPSRATGPRRFWTAMLLAAITLPGLTAVLVLLGEHVDLAIALVLYLLAVVVIALVGGLVPALLAAFAAGLLADYYFTLPVHSLRVERLSDVLGLVVYVVTAALVGTAAGTAARRTYQAVRASAEARALSRLASAMMHGQNLPTLLEQVREDFGLDAVSLLERDTARPAEPRWCVVASTGTDPPERPYDADVESPVGDDLTLAGRGRPLSSDDQRVLGVCAAQLGMAYSQGRLVAHDVESRLRAEAEHTRASLLLTASRDLRGPLHVADEALISLHNRLVDPEQNRLLDTARSSVRQVVQLVSDLDALSRLHAGALDLYLRPLDLDEVLTAVLDALGPGGRTVRCSLPEQLPDVIADAAVLTRVLTALAAEAQRHSPPDRTALLTAETRPGIVEIRLTDGAEGVTAGTRPGRTVHGLTLRMSRDLVETMGGMLEPGVSGAGFEVKLTLPAAAPRTTTA